MNLLLVDAGQLVNGVIIDTGAQSYGYDAAGRRTMQTVRDATGSSGQVQVYGYDFADRLVEQKSSTFTSMLRTDRTVVYDASAGTQKETRFDYGSAVGNTVAYKRYDATQQFNSLGQATARTDYVLGYATGSTSGTPVYQIASQSTTYDLVGNVATVATGAWASPSRAATEPLRIPTRP